jgi:hypothetical protein
MCGATSQQNQLTNEEIQTLQQGNQMTQQQYANQQAIYQPMAKQFQSIFAGGPSQTGYSQAELNSLDSQAVEGTAENYAGAAKAVGEATAAEGGGTNPLPSGGQTQLKQEVADSAAGEESKEETGITQSDYQQGYNEWQDAGAGLQSIAAGENPIGYENAATGEADAANSEANAVATEQNSWVNAALGAAGDVGKGWASDGFKT